MTSDDADRFLEEGRRRYDNGETDELPYCLQFCIGNRLPIPDWLATAFMTAYEKIISFEAASWDDVFGKHLRKGGRLARDDNAGYLPDPFLRLYRSVTRPDDLSTKNYSMRLVGSLALAAPLPPKFII